MWWHILFVLPGLIGEGYSLYKKTLRLPREVLVVMQLVSNGLLQNSWSLEGLCRNRPADQGLRYVCGCFAREGYYLREWITYYLNLGFDKIVLFDTNKDDVDLDYIQDVRCSCVEFVNKRNINFTVPLQAQLYNEFYARLRPIDWCLFVDIDEFLFVKEVSLDVYLNRANEANCSIVKINWVTYGNNGQILWHPGGVLERFPNPVVPLNFSLPRAYRCFNSLVKSLARGGLNGTNIESALADNFLNLIRRNLNGNDARSVRRKILTRIRQRSSHNLQKMQTGGMCVSQSLLHNLTSFTRPIAMPATAALHGTPASNNARDPPQTEAMDEDPFDSVISETTRMVYGKRSISGRTARKARLAKRP